MVLHRERRPDRIRTSAEQVFYPFWDAGFALGHAVRTVPECLDEASERLDVLCSLLDARPLSGDAGLVEDLGRRLLAAVGKRRTRWIEELAADAAERQERPGACSTSLEPDLKEGSGGLRDVHAVGWTRRIAGTGDDAGSSLIRDDELVRVDAAEEFLIRVRSALHLHTGKRTDRLVREHQHDLAPALGFDATAGLDAADAFMRGVFEHGRHVEHVRSLVMERALAEARRGARHAVAVPVPPASPEDVLEHLVGFARDEVTPPAAWLDALRTEDLGPAPFPWSVRMLDAFLGLLELGGRGVDALEVLDRADLLTGFIPEWADVRCRPQADPYHRFSVDVHLLRTLEILAGIFDGTRAGDQTLAAATTGAGSPRPVLLGALLHDIGKVGLGRHVEVGERVARSILDRMVAPADLRDDVLFLVREHLLLSDTATRRDLGDPNLVLDVAARVRDPRRLAMLYMLTVADAEATGPHAATGWRLGLVRELVGRVQRVLEREEMDPQRARELEDRVSRVRALLGREPGFAVDAYLRRLPRPYLLAAAPEDVAAHFALLSTTPGSTDVRTTARAGGRAGTWELTVVAADRPGLLARVAGSLALAGLSILSAQAFTTEDGVAIDLFVVESAFHGDVDEERWRTFRHTLRRALEGKLSLEYRVRERRKRYGAGRPTVPNEVRILNDASDQATVVEVETADRPGLLFDIARTFEELHLDVSLAKVATYGPRVIDAFYVRDLYGEKVDDPEHAREVRRAILGRLEDRD